MDQNNQSLPTTLWDEANKAANRADSTENSNGQMRKKDEQNV